jgi:hypothetical protein
LRESYASPVISRSVEPLTTASGKFWIKYFNCI